MKSNAPHKNECTFFLPQPRNYLKVDPETRHQGGYFEGWHPGTSRQILLWGHQNIASPTLYLSLESLRYEIGL